MEYQEIYTITIVRNIGIPISFTVKRWKVLFLFVIGLIFATFLIVASIHYLFLLSKVSEVSNKLKVSQKKEKYLVEQMARLDHDRYWKSDEIRHEEISAIKSDMLEQPEFSTEGIWITNKPTLSEEEFQEGRAVEVERFNSSVKGDILRLSVRIKNISNPPQAVGGYICLTLVNNDVSPPIHKSLNEDEIGENGFPSSYKSGNLYNIKRRTGTKHMKFKLTNVNEYYTDVMVFLYSYQGRLLNRHNVALKKEIFLE